MPKKYPKETKIDALVQLSMLDDINAVHQITGIPKRTLRSWREQIRNKSNRVSAEKSLPMATKNVQTPPDGNKTDDDGNKGEKHGIKTDNDGNKQLESGNKNAPNGDHFVPPAEKTYPYPLEEDDDENSNDYESFKKIRDRLMQHAQTLADDLLNNPENVNLQTLALARILDRIMQLDELIPNHNPERVIRFEYVYEGSVHNVPPWRTASADDPPLT